MKIKRTKDQRAVEKYRTTRSGNNIDLNNDVRKKDEENFIPYLPKDHHTEVGLSVGTTFDKQIQESVMDITGDDSDMLKAQRSVMKWDANRKKFVSTDKGKKGKKIKTESGAWIAASYKSDRYQAWKERSKVEQQEEGDEDDVNDDYQTKGSNPAYRSPAFSRRLVKTGKNEAPAAATGSVKGKGVKFNSELKRPEQILKDRKVKEKKRLKNTSSKSKKKKSGHSRNSGGGFGKGKKKK